MPFIISSNRVLLAHALSMSRPEHVPAILFIEARLNTMEARIEARLDKMEAYMADQSSRCADLETNAENHAKKVDTIQKLCVILQKSIDDLAVGLHDLGNDVDAM